MIEVSFESENDTVPYFCTLPVLPRIGEYVDVRRPTDGTIITKGTITAIDWTLTPDLYGRNTNMRADVHLRDDDA